MQGGAVTVLNGTANVSKIYRSPLSCLHSVHSLSWFPSKEVLSGPYTPRWGGGSETGWVGCARTWAVLGDHSQITMRGGRTSGGAGACAVGAQSAQMLSTCWVAAKAWSYLTMLLHLWAFAQLSDCPWHSCIAYTGSGGVNEKRSWARALRGSEPWTALSPCTAFWPFDKFISSTFCIACSLLPHGGGIFFGLGVQLWMKR